MYNDIIMQPAHPYPILEEALPEISIQLESCLTTDYRDATSYYNNVIICTKCTMLPCVEVIATYHFFLPMTLCNGGIQP